MNPFTKINQELKSSFQAAINALGKKIYDECSFESEQNGTVITWSGFGHESSTWYHVAAYTQRDFGLNIEKTWVCVGSMVISSHELDFAAVRKD